MTYSLKDTKKNAHADNVVSVLAWDWPEAEGILKRLNSLLIAGGLPKEESSKITAMVADQSVGNYGRAVQWNGNRKKPDAERLGAFICSAIRSTVIGLSVGLSSGSRSISVSTENGQVRWVDTDGSGGAFDEKLVRAWLYQELLSEDLKAVLRKTGYEEAVLVGDFDFVCSGSCSSSSDAGAVCAELNRKRNRIFNR